MALHEQRRTREAGTDPVVLLHFGQRADAKALVTLCISNVGAGAALNVALTVEAPEGDLSRRHLITDVFVEHHPFRVLKQNATIEFALSMGWNLLGDDPLPPFNAHVAYEDVDGNEYEACFVMDIREMKALGANDLPETRAAKALEKIAQSHTALVAQVSHGSEHPKK